MLELAGFNDQEALHSGRRSLLVRAVRVADGRRVVLKTSASALPSPAQVERLEAEHARGTRVRHPALVEVLGLERCGERPVLVLVDGGQSLDRGGLPLSFDRFISCALQLTEGLGALHAAGLLHGDVAPSHVLLDPDGRRVRICDLGATAPLIGGAGSAGVLADLRALGRTLYALLCGELPAATARAPLDRGAPAPLSDLILRLMAQEPARGYRSAAAVAADLGTLRAQLDGGGRLTRFTLGRLDRAAPGKSTPPAIAGPTRSEPSPSAARTTARPTPSAHVAASGRTAHAGDEREAEGEALLAQMRAQRDELDRVTARLLLVERALGAPPKPERKGKPATSPKGRGRLAKRAAAVMSYPQLRALEKENLRRALELSDWKVSGPGGAAELLEANASTLASRIRALDLRRRR